MPTITCKIEGHEYQLQYNQIVLKNGIRIWGTLFLQEPFSFNFFDFNIDKYKSSLAETEKIICDEIEVMALKINNH